MSLSEFLHKAPTARADTSGRIAAGLLTAMLYALFALPVWRTFLAPTTSPSHPKSSQQPANGAFRQAAHHARREMFQRSDSCRDPLFLSLIRGQESYTCGPSPANIVIGGRLMVI